VAYDCHDRGQCVENICRCDQYITGDHCEITFAAEIGAGFLVFRFGFMILFLALALFDAVQLYRINKEGGLGKLRGICLWFILGHTVLRFLYFATDPLGQTHNIPYLLEQFIFYFAFFFIISSYLVAVLFWAGMYHGSVQRGRILVKKTKYLFIVLDSILFITSVIQSIAYGVPLSAQLQPLLLDIYDFYLVIIAFGLSSVMLIYGALVYYKKRKFSKQFRTTTTHDMSKIVKLTSTLVVISATIYLVIILLIIVVALNLNAYPKAAIASISVAYLLELAVASEMLYLMTPRSSSSSPSLPLSDPQPVSSGSATSPSDVEEPSSFRLELETVTTESSGKQDSSETTYKANN